MTKTYLELATEVVTAMVNKGYLRIPADKSEDWQKFNKKAVHTIGWAIEEMYREVMQVPERAKKERKEEPKKKIILTK